LRQRLLQLTTVHTNQSLQKFKQLIDGRICDAFIEADLRRWKHILNDLKANLASPSTIAINQYTSTPLIQNINVISTATSELFLQAFDNKVEIEENDQLVIHDVSTDPTEIQGRNVYTTGCYKIRLCIEQFVNK